MAMDSLTIRRAQGALAGQIAGDSLGSLVEFRSSSSIEAEYPEGVRLLADGGTWDTLAGQPTDDSEMALALARSIMSRGRFDAVDVHAAYRAWLESSPFDIGHTTASGLHGRHVQDSQANGSLMRVSPLAIFGHALTPDALAEIAREDSDLTHRHPVCRDSVTVYSVAIAHAVRTGANGRDTYDAALRWAKDSRLESSVVKALEAAADARPSDFMHQMGWVLLALQNAFYELLHAESFEEGVVRTVGAGGDTDTNGAIAGALLGAVHGVDAVPRQWLNAILSCRTPRPRVYWPVDVLTLAEALATLGAEFGD